jgi:uncharacterized protein YbjT (DUF2867 family)
MSDERNSLLYIDRLTAAIAASGQTATYFCHHHFRDPNFMARARRGVNWQAKTVDLVTSVLREYEV